MSPSFEEFEIFIWVQQLPAGKIFQAKLQSPAFSVNDRRRGRENKKMLKGDS